VLGLRMKCGGSRSVWFGFRCSVLTMGDEKSLVSDLGFGRRGKWGEVEGFLVRSEAANGR
jgi:hypothetical protein